MSRVLLTQPVSPVLYERIRTALEAGLDRGMVSNLERGECARYAQDAEVLFNFGSPIYMQERKKGESDMNAYAIFEEDVTDPENLQEYIRQAGPILARYGGKVLTAGGTIEVIEGIWHPKLLVILEFASIEQAKRWYQSKEYTSVKALRHKASNTNLLLIEGTQGIQWHPKEQA